VKKLILAILAYLAPLFAATIFPPFCHYGITGARVSASQWGAWFWNLPKFYPGADYVYAHAEVYYTMLYLEYFMIITGVTMLLLLLPLGKCAFRSVVKKVRSVFESKPGIGERSNFKVSNTFEGINSSGPPA